MYQTAQPTYGSITPSYAHTQSYLSSPSYTTHTQHMNHAHIQPTVHKREAPLVFTPERFVTKTTAFVNDAEALQPYIEEAYQKVTATSLPENLTINVCDKEELKHAHQFFNGKWTEGIQGFYVKKALGNSHIFVLQGEKAKVMLTLGHELGHAQGRTLTAVEEEAKAYAFSMAWMEKIQQENIAGLAGAYVTEDPARNGLHNIAFSYVKDMLHQGKKALDIVESLLHGTIVETFKYTV